MRNNRDLRIPVDCCDDDWVFMSNVRVLVFGMVLVIEMKAVDFSWRVMYCRNSHTEDLCLELVRGLSDKRYLLSSRGLGAIFMEFNCCCCFCCWCCCCSRWLSVREELRETCLSVGAGLYIGIWFVGSCGKGISWVNPDFRFRYRMLKIEFREVVRHWEIIILWVLVTLTYMVGKINGKFERINWDWLE